MIANALADTTCFSRPQRPAHPLAAGDGARRLVVECKVLDKGLERTIREGLDQTEGFMGRCAAEAGHLVIFDRDEERSWDEKVFCRRESANGVEVLVWGMRCRAALRLPTMGNAHASLLWTRM